MPDLAEVFPGEKSSGLIEAPRGRGVSLRRRSTFPGEKSSGLIEARPAYPLTGYAASFPGEKSSGLIEAPVL